MSNVGNTSFANDAHTGTTGSDGTMVNVQQLAAAGTSSQANSTPVTDFRTVLVVTCAASTAGIRLPVVATGVPAVLDVYNCTATKCLIYPGAGAAIGAGSANASTSVAGNKALRFIAQSSTQWQVLAGA